MRVDGSTSSENREKVQVRKRYVCGRDNGEVVTGKGSVGEASTSEEGKQVYG